MLSTQDLIEQQDRIVELLSSTERKGMGDLVSYMLDGGFFDSPASQEFHGVYVGGLAFHSIGVFCKFSELNKDKNLGAVVNRGQKPLEFNEVNFIIVTLLHDLCKMGAYVRTKADTGWTNNPKKDKGHALLSIERIKMFITLEPIEEMMIKFHMGIYHAIEYDDKAGEYNLLFDRSVCKGMSKEESAKFRYCKSYRNALYHNPIVKLMSIADELATMEEKALEF